MPPTFTQFSDNLYCSGSEQRLCVLPHAASPQPDQPGECLWFDGSRPVTHEDMSREFERRWPKDRWDAVAAGAVGAEHFKRYNKTAAAACLDGQHVVVLGESTTRDLFSELAAQIGLKPPSGACMNTGGYERGSICTRVVQTPHTNATRLTFQFLSRANSTREVGILRTLLANRPPTAVFVYCFMYDWYGYNERGIYGLWHGESDDMGNACDELLTKAIRTHHPHTPIYLLGPTYPPSWVSPYPNRTRDDSAMARIFRSINHGMGIRCERKSEQPQHVQQQQRHGGGGGGGGGGGSGGGGGGYRVVSTKGVRGPLDRYNIVGNRKRDRIHPFANAHAPTVQMMLNSLCPRFPGGGGSAKRAVSSE